MIVVYVSVKIRPGATSGFERMISEIQGEVRKMPGCVKMQWYSVPNDPERYITYGEFVTQEDFERYLNSASVKRINDELIPLLEVPPEFRHYQATILESS